MTTPERWQEIQRVVDAALDLAPVARGAYLDQTCRGDPGLRDEAGRLLDARERAARGGGLFAMPATLAAGLGSVVSDRYVIERELGHGGMATVYLARDLRHDREVAVKVLEAHVAPAGAERFIREIRIAARLTHPHVLGVHDSGESDGRLYYVMPYVAGETLRSRLTRDGALPLADAVRLRRELADALAYAHEHGVVHRDLKPENVLLSGGHAVVADFRIAKAVAAATSSGNRLERDNANDPQTRGRLTATGVAIGTPAYMAPEQAVGDGTMDHRADLYALGLIAYEMLTGAHPFTGRTAQALATAHLTETPAPLTERRPDVPPAVASLVMQLLAKNPDARPQSAGDVLRVLDRVVAAPASAQRRRRPVPLVVGMAMALMAGAAGASYYILRSQRAPAPSAGPAASQMIAVLPFTNTSGSPNDEYFSDGLTDELAHALAHVPGLRIAGRSSSYAFKGKSVPATEIGKALGVAAIIEGTVRRSGDRLRVTTQLVRATDGTVLWDSAYESGSRDAFAVQDSLTRAVVASLAPTLSPHDVRADSSIGAAILEVNRGTTDREAYDLYLRGRYYWHERGADNVMRSIDYFKRAIARDPTFARAYAGLALAYNVLDVYVPDASDSATTLLKPSARSAMTLDSTLADAQLAMAFALERDLRFAEAEMHYRAALRIEPSNQYAHHSYGFMLINVGRTKEAIDELRHATRLDPLAKSAGTALAEALINARRFREAAGEARRILAIDSTFPLAIYGLGGAQEFGGQPDSAVRTLERGVRLYPDLLALRGRLLFAYAAAGQWDDVERMRAALRGVGRDQTGGVLPAVADYVLGNREPLIRLITTHGDRRRWFNMLQATGAGEGCNPVVDPLWPDDRYRTVMRDLGVGPCPQTRPWAFPPRAETASPRAR
jgi:serine/threonine protein kinase/tetratricopeptide (TPR) repeat protein